ncbi:hypothetical protein [Dictyobacter aurantiacus]|uniref:Uncharacterized protein n=1 Tax=Dictyobacter aurantiacus TaxID=1936993 RepID=A0A401Z9T2_9CHLR|nr:hypothetical protein [Dictyobacter aurantiacus]GCE03573.1 hypothetical protein KDAU_09020 [Dictyobacter aurantiacus]
MGGSSFDLIAQELLNQRHIMEELDAENRQLRQQLNDLRAGKGIFVEINGTRIALDTLQATSSTPSVDAPIEMPEDEQSEKDASVDTNTLPSEQQAEVTQPVAQQPQITTPLYEENKESTQPTFLEEIMLDEFAAALTSRQAVLPQPEKKAEPSEEEQKASLRRELMGSFLLE